MKFKPKNSEEEYSLSLKKKTYASGGINLSLIDDADGMPYASCTVNVPDLALDEVAIKDYSENEGIYDLLVDNNIIERSHRTVYTGYVSLYVCKII